MTPGLAHIMTARRICSMYARYLVAFSRLAASNLRKKVADVVVTVPKWFGLDAWIAEGDPAGEPWSGQEWHFYLGGPVPNMRPGERVYVVFNGRLRGYAPLVRIERYSGGRYALVRHGGAVAVTVEEKIRGFRGFRYRFWNYADEEPFPEWRMP